MEDKLQLNLPFLLPETNGECARCAERLKKRISEHKGIEKVHLKEIDGQSVLCLHYDPHLVSLSTVQRVAEEAGTQISGQYRHENFHIIGMDCTDCARSIEHIISHIPGIIDVSVSYAAEKMRVDYATTIISHKELVQRIKWMGYDVEEREKKSLLKDNREVVLSLLAGFFLILGFSSDSTGVLSRQASTGLYALAYLAGGFDATRHALKAAIHARFDIDFLMVVAALGAALVGRWPEGALLLFLFSPGHAGEHYAMGKARRAIQALGEITPKTARLMLDGMEKDVSIEYLKRSDMVMVRPGERMPIDGLVIKGSSFVDQSPITGESIPVEKSQGDLVFAGTVNREGSLEIDVSKLAKDTTLARVVQLVEEAQTQKSPTQNFTEHLEEIFVPLILASVIILIVVPPLTGLLSWEEAFMRAMIILVASSPCALAIATPSAVLAAVAQAARRGVLIKGGVHLENLGEIEAIAFDKTGTITIGRPEVTDIYPLKGSTIWELLRISAAVESRSCHPLAQAVHKKALEEGLGQDLPLVDSLQSIPGRGVLAELEGKVVRIGNLKLFNERSGASFREHQDVITKVQELEEEGKTTMVVEWDDRFLGVIALADRPREETKQMLKRLKKLGIKSIIMITGDNERVSTAVAKEVGITELRAGLLPQEKVSALEELLNGYGKVAMVGDGINDAPALVRATVGIAMGASGTDVALETADVALMADDLSKLPFALALSRQSRHIILQNLTIALGVIILLVPAALLGWAGMGLAIILHEGSTLLVVFNALRLLRFGVE